jgi:hypothetical protein
MKVLCDNCKEDIILNTEPSVDSKVVCKLCSKLNRILIAPPVDLDRTDDLFTWALLAAVWSNSIRYERYKKINR